MQHDLCFIAGQFNFVNDDLAQFGTQFKAGLCHWMWSQMIWEQVLISTLAIDQLPVPLFTGHHEDVLEPGVFAGEDMPLQSRDLSGK